MRHVKSSAAQRRDTVAARETVDLQPIGGDLAQTLLDLARTAEAECDAERFRTLARRYMPLDGAVSS